MASIIVTMDSGVDAGLEESPSRAGFAGIAEDLDDALLEAAACGDVGFLDRITGCWSADPDGVLGGRGAPADPVDVVGAVEWLRLTARGRNQSDARFLAALHLVAHHGGAHDHAGHPVRDPFAADEVGAALGWSTGSATYQLGLADAIVQRLPKLYEAMAEGWLDLGKATTVVEATRAMPDDLAGMALARVLPVAAGVSKAELALRLDVAAGQLDPDWATRREQAARRNVRVEGIRNPTGTADVALRDLGVEDAARARARIEALAVPVRRAARAAGIPVGIVLVRALVAQRLWDGTHTGIDDDTLITRLVDELPTWYAALHHDDNGPGDDPDTGADEPGDSGPDDDGPDGGPDGGPDDEGPDGSRPDETGGARRGAVELRMRLSTALDLDDLPAELVTHGTLTAAGARRMLHHTCRGDVPVECRLVLVDADGHLEHVLLVPLSRHRQRRRTARGIVIVELAIPTTDLAALDPAAHPEWHAWLRRAQQRLVALPEQGAQLGGPRHPATTTDDATRRLPGRELDRYLRVRDRHCIGPMCTRPTYAAEIDHTCDWQHHGRTLAVNLGTPCHHCHRLKHLGGWRLEQPAPGRFVWHTPLDAIHAVEPRPVLRTPLDPAPRPHGRPRPLLDSSGLRRERDGWIDRVPRATCPATVPAPPHRRPRAPDLAGDPHDDDPPPF